MLPTDIKIGAKVIRHGRYVCFQMAEIAVMFAEILSLIARQAAIGEGVCRGAQIAAMQRFAALDRWFRALCARRVRIAVAQGDQSWCSDCTPRRGRRTWA